MLYALASSVYAAQDSSLSYHCSAHGIIAQHCGVQCTGAGYCSSRFFSIVLMCLSFITKWRHKYKIHLNDYNLVPRKRYCGGQFVTKYIRYYSVALVRWPIGCRWWNNIFVVYGIVGLTVGSWPNRAKSLSSPPYSWINYEVSCLPQLSFFS